MVYPLILLLLLAAICLTARIVWFGLWIALRGTQVVIPWSISGLPEYAPLSFLGRTRDCSRLCVSNRDHCDLVFWTHPPTLNAMSLLIDAVTGFTGAVAVGVDCGLRAIGEENAERGKWLITAGPFGRGAHSGAGPHYAPESSFPGQAIARVDITKYIDALKLRKDVEEQIQDPSVRSKGAAVFSFIFGDVSNRYVTCSGLIGQAILRQECTPLGGALQRALRERFNRGGITPADLARAVAVLGLAPKDMSQPIEVRRIWVDRAAPSQQSCALRGKL
jgi:hypothetical protein